ncbi:MULTISPECIES: YihY/virulence factor BrkB family protein [unclassified Campylobacter]|uniref:YihY/virulence factor BrkB family protein n=1 Tax=unclassified Campylobacter TaxID=2593542 RepID=UPI00123828DA|nr:MULTISPECIES: YihY/virulence factor BrkB family protein [unclassified Campylobacter]KAA6226674.1 YihY/virulence factor BrkB family protein [Campylobacter sp. LR286c]KAA6227696.1 YihY/virulence factor BrkB family protein [Campylobacter sp. LR196d]KAA6227706.1 YihY/virulence factor BrkB family protein [Campylobacter sp. LR185c]KAA6231237.1 YihY/virulence factor BrkB family protein [Campylobacter sp. LR291e]KAA6234126.1 YihY/virulence factor BrkB family protein [Campylobacter sp. LR264d]
MLKKIFRLLAVLKDKEIFNYASSLSFYTILSLIPILFVCFSVFTQIPSFKEHYSKAKQIIFTFLIPDQQDLVANYLDTFLTNSVNLGIFGLIAMAVTSLAFFSSYDFVINKISDNEPKNLWHSISSYWTLLTLVPLGLGLSFYISGFIQKTLDDYKIGFNFFEILPFIIVWGLFFVSYSSSLQKGGLKALFTTSFLASMFWYICKNLFVYYIVYNKTYTSVYGSFSIILFFFIWIYISWVIYLFGLKAYYSLSKYQDERNKIKTDTKKPQVRKTNTQQRK